MVATKRWKSASWRNALLWGFVAPAVALFTLVIGVSDLPHSLSAARNEGTPGSFTAKRSDCGGRGGCTYYGTFVSDGGAMRLTDVFIDDGVNDVGQTVPAQYLEGRVSDKVYEVNSHEWIWLVSLMIAAVTYLVGWGWLIVRPWLHLRRA